MVLLTSFLFTLRHQPMEGDVHNQVAPPPQISSVLVQVWLLLFTTLVVAFNTGFFFLRGVCECVKSY